MKDKVKEQLAQALVEAIQEDVAEGAEWKGLMDRPPEDDGNWRPFHSWSPIFGGTATIMQHFDPETGEMDWVDYPPQHPESYDWHKIASGAQDTSKATWNSCWMPAEFINEAYGYDGMKRLYHYAGKAVRYPVEHWPEPYKSVFLAGHPGWTGLGPDA